MITLVDAYNELTSNWLLLNIQQSAVLALKYNADIYSTWGGAERDQHPAADGCIRWDQS